MRYRTGVVHDDEGCIRLDAAAATDGRLSSRCGRRTARGGSWRATKTRLKASRIQSRFNKQRQAAAWVWSRHALQRGNCEGLPLCLRQIWLGLSAASLTDGLPKQLQSRNTLSRLVETEVNTSHPI